MFPNLKLNILTVLRVSYKGEEQGFIKDNAYHILWAKYIAMASQPIHQDLLAMVRHCVLIYVHSSLARHMDIYTSKCFSHRFLSSRPSLLELDGLLLLFHLGMEEIRRRSISASLKINKKEH